MSIQAFGSDFPKSTEFLDQQSGLPNKNWLYLLLQLWNRTGQGTGIVPVVDAGLVASGTTLADALSLVADWNSFGTVAAGTGCKILPLKPGNDIQVFNAGANSISIYPPTGADQIDALGAGQPFVLAAGKLRVFECWGNSPSQFYSFGN